MALVDLIDRLSAFVQSGEYFREHEWPQVADLDEEIGGECLVLGIAMPPVSMPQRYSGYQPFGFTQIPHSLSRTNEIANGRRVYVHEVYVTPDWLQAIKVLRRACEKQTADPKADSKIKIPKSDRVWKAIKAVNDHYDKVASGKADKLPENAIVSEHLSKPVENKEVKNLTRQLRNYRHLIRNPADS